MKNKRDGFGHEKPFEGEMDDWITPLYIIEAFNSLKNDGNLFFDLDPCMSDPQPWVTADYGYCKDLDGLKQNWFGMVYCNPPYGNNVGAWARKMAEYRNGIMLIFARVETAVWQDIIFPTASGFLFPRRRIAFARPNGTTPKSSSGAPSAFVSWGEEARYALFDLCRSGKIEGAFLPEAFCAVRTRR